MQDIADAFGILKGSLYHYVKSKEDLLWLSVEEPLNNLVDSAATILADRSLPVIERIRLAIASHVGCFERYYLHMIVITGEYATTLRARGSARSGSPSSSPRSSPPGSWPRDPPSPRRQLRVPGRTLPANSKADAALPGPPTESIDGRTTRGDGSRSA